MAKMSGSANETSISSHDPRATSPKAQRASPWPFRLQAMRGIPSFYNKSQRPTNQQTGCLARSSGIISVRSISGRIYLLTGRKTIRLTSSQTAHFPDSKSLYDQLRDAIGVSGVTCDKFYTFLDRKVFVWAVSSLFLRAYPTAFGQVLASGVKNIACPGGFTPSISSPELGDVTPWSSLSRGQWTETLPFFGWVSAIWFPIVYKQ